MTCLLASVIIHDAQRVCEPRTAVQAAGGRSGKQIATGVQLPA